MFTACRADALRGQKKAPGTGIADHCELLYGGRN